MPTEAGYYNLDEESMKVFAEEFGSTAERETAIKENMYVTQRQFALGEWKE